MKEEAPIILASSSPRRRELLAQLGVSFVVEASEADEDHFIARTPEEMVIELAIRKAVAVARSETTGLVIGADTTVVLDGEWLGKPGDFDEAASYLRRLRARTHQVFTGVALMDVASDARATVAVRSDVRMRDISDAEIAAYVATGEPMDKAGAYGIQGSGRALVESVNGCFNNVVGLPLCAVAGLLERLAPRIVGNPAVCRLENGEPCLRIAEMERARWG